MPAELPPAELRRVEPGDWPAVKRLRLEALADTPLGFLETHEAAAGLPDDAWRYRAVRGSQGGDSCQLFVVRDGVPVGTAVTFPDAVDPAVWWVVAVYLRPEARGEGLLGRLVEALGEHARGHGARLLRLQVHEDNGRARAAYRRLGFAETGEREPYPLGDGDELTMARALS
ncbi:MAG: GCN5-related N-acetyltransferase [Frankiales bacterium]|nr:GCN5-related N-acetyltransferase [Frankiales bacterium]